MIFSHKWGILQVILHCQTKLTGLWSAAYAKIECENVDIKRNKNCAYRGDDPVQAARGEGEAASSVFRMSLAAASGR